MRVGGASPARVAAGKAVQWVAGPGRLQRGTARACEQAGAALGCATLPEIGASFHLGLHPLARPAVQILGARFGTSSEWFRTLLGHKSHAKALHPGNAA